MASSSTVRPLRGSCRPMKKTVGPSVGHGATWRLRWTSTPLNRTSYRPPREWEAMAAASSETANDRSKRRLSHRTGRFNRS